MGKVRKPTSITTIKDCEEALEWIDVELEKLDRNIRITNRAIFSPKKWTTAISGILWSKQVKQKTSDHVCNSPFLSKLEGRDRKRVVIDVESLEVLSGASTPPAEAIDRAAEAFKAPGIEADSLAATRHQITEFIRDITTIHFFNQT